MKEITKKSLVAIGIIMVFWVFVLFLVSRQDRTEEATKRTEMATNTETAQPPQTPATTNTETAQQQQEPSYTLSARQLHDEYKANEVAADMKYKGHIVVISGKIDSIGKDIFDQAYIVVDGESLSGGVHCTFAKDEESSIARLSKGQYVTVKGKVSGGGVAGGPLLDKCTLQ